MIGAFVSFFLQTTAGRLIAAGLALWLWTAYQRDQAADEARAECQETALRATVAEQQRLLEAAKKTAQDAQVQASQSNREMAALRRDTESINEDAKPLAANPCAVPEPARRRLQNIR